MGVIIMIYVFGRCEIDLQNYELRYQGNTVAVGPKIFDLLVHLIEHRDRVVARQGITDYQAIGAESGSPYFLALLAEVYHQSGYLEEGLCTILEALALVEQNGERWWEAELYRPQAALWCQHPACPYLQSVHRRL